MFEFARKLLAAPTPPAPVLQLETQLSDHDVKALHDYLVRVTPPAQEDEPVAWLKQRWKRSCGDDVLAEEVVNHLPEKFSGCRYIALTHPVDGKLRKAAEEFLNVAKTITTRFDSVEHDKAYQNAERNLRAALDNKK